MKEEIIIDQKNTADHWLELVAGYRDSKRGQFDVWQRIQVKWDGCIHYERFYNRPEGLRDPKASEDDRDYIHICDLDNYIEQLNKIRDMAKAHFGKDWPK